jgi:hypothetical protein
MWASFGALPGDFAHIPPQSLAGAVLPTVAGTPQAHEAAISNSIPQTATIPLAKGPLPARDIEYFPNLATGAIGPLAGRSPLPLCYECPGFTCHALRRRPAIGRASGGSFARLGFARRISVARPMYR